MKKNRLPFIILLLFVSTSLHAQHKEVLFLGNSYTYFNDLPKLVADIAKSNGDSLYHESNTPGGYTLERHVTNTNSINKIKNKKWDHVVIQEQSQRPSFSPGQVSTDVFPYAEKLDSMIRANDSCTTPLFYMTWGRKFGDASNCAFYPPICTYDGMQQRLKESYLQMANDNNGHVAPVGSAWKRSIGLDPALNLYTADNSHPNLHGSYLAACVFYSAIFHRSSVGSFHPAGITAPTAAFLQAVADSTVFDSLNLWKIDTVGKVNSNYTYTVNDLKVQFNGTTNATTPTYTWDFGDGSTGVGADPEHEYAEYGRYDVTLFIRDGCKTSTITQSIEVVEPIITRIDEINADFSVALYPNPAKDFLTIEAQESISAIQIFNQVGKRVYTDSFSSNKGVIKIEVDQFPRGIYFVRIDSQGEQIQRKVLLR